MVKEHQENRIHCHAQYRNSKISFLSLLIVNDNESIYYDIKFGQVMVNANPHIEDNERYTPLLPHEARLRNITYSTEIYVNVTVEKILEESILPRGQT